jgi:2-methylcitrate dehydratase
VRTALDAAAFANGVMVRHLDLNDAWRTKGAHHPSDYLPGILGVAEHRGASDEAFIVALAVAYEIVCRFTDLVPFNTAGWDQPVTGAIASAMAAGRLLRLSRGAMHQPLSLAVVPNLCTYQTRAGVFEGDRARAFLDAARVTRTKPRCRPHCRSDPALAAATPARAPHFRDWQRAASRPSPRK